MEAKQKCFNYTKDNHLEVAYVNTEEGIKITIGSPNQPVEQQAVLLSLDKLESFILYLKKIARIAGKQMEELKRTENVEYDVITKALSVNWDSYG